MARHHTCLTGADRLAPFGDAHGKYAVESAARCARFGALYESPRRERATWHLAPLTRTGGAKCQVRKTSSYSSPQYRSQLPFAFRIAKPGTEPAATAMTLEPFGSAAMDAWVMPIGVVAPVGMGGVPQPPACQVPLALRTSCFSMSVPRVAGG